MDKLEVLFLVATVTCIVIGLSMPSLSELVLGENPKFFDTWTFVHYSFWFVIGANYSWHSVPWYWAVAITAVGAYLWEFLEAYLERRNWVTGTETPWNRWLSDPFISGVGAACGALWVG